MSGVFGMVGAVMAHDATDTYCAKHKTGLTRGGKMVKKAQAASYAAVLATSISVGHSDFFDIKDITPQDKSEAISHDNDRQPQSIKQRANQHGLALAG
tara:strand:+ start:217566 stop:217859 length:294 start_codon:yes stop_codon:yes gene_type:complete